MKNGKRMGLLFSTTALFLTCLLMVFILFAWYAVNKQANVTAGTGVTAANESIRILDEVKAVKYSLNGDITTNTYNRNSSGRLVLVKSEIYTAETKTTVTITEFTEVEYFVIREMLPGEHVDITIGYTIDESMDGSNYTIYLKNIVGDAFVIDEKTHYVTGAFRYKSMSLKDSNNLDVVGFTPDSDYTWFNEYSISQNDSATLDKTILHHTWDSNYGSLYYTFSIYEDFTQYYRLIAQSENSYGNLLSRKNFNIGEIFVILG